MDLKKRLQQERQTNLGNIIDKPWFPAIVFLIFAIVLGPEVYKHFKKPTIADCADVSFSLQYSWNPKFLDQTTSTKLQTNKGYERHWQNCEREKQRFPEKFDEKYKNVRKVINQNLDEVREAIKKSAWNDKKN